MEMMSASDTEVRSGIPSVWVGAQGLHQRQVLGRAVMGRLAVEQAQETPLRFVQLSQPRVANSEIHDDRLAEDTGFETFRAIVNASDPALLESFQEPSRPAEFVGLKESFRDSPKDSRALWKPAQGQLASLFCAEAARR